MRGAPLRLAPVRYFLMGAGSGWHEAEQWPPPEARPLALHLHSAGHANTAQGDGVLAEATPADSETADRYVYDPEHPVPTCGGALLQVPGQASGPADQQQLEARSDVLCYSTPPMAEALSIAGPVTVELWAVSDASDTDWTAKLVDAYPDGRAISLTDGIVRARYRDSYSEPQPLTPGEPYRYSIDLAHMAYTFGAGHRVRLEVSSSNFPRFDRNPNTGTTIAEETASRPAAQQVLHDAEHASALHVYVLEA